MLSFPTRSLLSVQDLTFDTHANAGFFDVILVRFFHIVMTISGLLTFRSKHITLACISPPLRIYCPFVASFQYPP